MITPLKMTLKILVVIAVGGITSIKASAQTCKVFSHDLDFSCNPNYLKQQLGAHQLELISVPQHADLELAYERVTERDEAGTHYYLRLVGRNNLLAGQEVGYGTYSSRFESHAKAARLARKSGQQQQQQRMGPHRCKEREYRKEQRALAELLPSLVTACKSIEQLRH